MKFSPGKCYKDLLLEYLSMAIGDLAYLPPFEDYCNEYLVDYSIEELEKVVRKFSKRGHTYFSFMVGVTWANCMRKWEKKNKKLSDEELANFYASANAGLNSLMLLTGTDDFSDDEMREFIETLVEEGLNDDFVEEDDEDCDDEDSEYNDDDFFNTYVGLSFDDDFDEFDDDEDSIPPVSDYDYDDEDADCDYPKN